jgi:hypothetical protein
MPQFAIEHLSESQLEEAWPVVRMSRSHAFCDWWVSESVALIARGGGILALRAPDHAIHGIATYEVARKARLGRVLLVDTLVAFELNGRAPVRHALCDALELLASAFNCRSIVLPIPSKGHIRHRAKRLYGLIDFEPPDSA